MAICKEIDFVRIVGMEVIDLASHKSTAICWRYQKAKGITKKRAAPVKRCCPFYFSFTTQKIFITFSEFFQNSC